MIPILFVGWHLIGIEPFCAVNPKEKSIECNYESMEMCEGYRQTNEICVPNPNLK